MEERRNGKYKISNPVPMKQVMFHQLNHCPSKLYDSNTLWLLKGIVVILDADTSIGSHIISPVRS
jgi:hypothetical protein